LNIQIDKKLHKNLSKKTRITNKLKRVYYVEEKKLTLKLIELICPLIFTQYMILLIKKLKLEKFFYVRNLCDDKFNLLKEILYRQSLNNKYLKFKQQ